jgi:hypothetical protein
MRMTLRVWFLVSAGLLIAAASWAQSPGTLPITFADSAVMASGLSAGKTVVWFGIERTVDADYSATLYQHYNTGTVAADGTAQLTLDHSVAAASVWVAVDLDTGAYGVNVPVAAFLNLTLPSSSSLLQGLGSAPDLFRDTRPYVLGLAIRPGQGAWLFGGGDGGPRDQDGIANGQLSFSLDGFDALPGSPAAPAKAGSTDIWFVIDPQAMQISVFQPLAGGKS